MTEATRTAKEEESTIVIRKSQPITEIELGGNTSLLITLLHGPEETWRVMYINRGVAFDPGAAFAIFVHPQDSGLRISCRSAVLPGEVASTVLRDGVASTVLHDKTSVSYIIYQPIIQPIGNRVIVEACDHKNRKIGEIVVLEKGIKVWDKRILFETMLPQKHS